MALVILPGLNNLIEDISEEKNYLQMLSNQLYVKPYLKVMKNIEEPSTLESKKIHLMKNTLVTLTWDLILMKKVIEFYQVK